MQTEAVHILSEWAHQTGLEVSAVTLEGLVSS